MTKLPAWAISLAEDRAVLDRSSTADRVADILRDQITAGTLRPGTQLQESVLTTALKVSRNTLREAFRLLGHERLVDHELNRGFFVRVPTVADVVDVYRIRRILETAAVRAAATAPAEALRRVKAALLEAEEAALADRWWDVGTANMRFHQALAGLAGSPRVDEAVRQLLAELRLVFHIMSAPRSFHEPYLRLNHVVHELIEDGKPAAAARELDKYLDAAEKQLVAAYTARTTSS